MDKQALLDIAERCKAGEKFSMCKNQEYSLALWSENEIRNSGWATKLFDAQTSLDAVKALEDELLPEGYEQDIAKELHGYEVSLFKRKMFCVDLCAPTEPLARLGALCLALAEGIEDV